jgi:hypothetical protein
MPALNSGSQPEYKTIGTVVPPYDSFTTYYRAREGFSSSLGILSTIETLHIAILPREYVLDVCRDLHPTVQIRDSVPPDSRKRPHGRDSSFC